MSKSIQRLKPVDEQNRDDNITWIIRTKKYINVGEQRTEK